MAYPKFGHNLMETEEPERYDNCFTSYHTNIDLDEMILLIAELLKPKLKGI